jgi:hypothetical protein
MKVRTAKEKELQDNARLLRAWRRWHRDEREEILAGPHGAVLNELFRMLANLKHVQPAQLIGYAQSINWPAINYTTKLIILHEFNNAITTYREKNGLEPIDDGIPGERDNAFRCVKAILFQRGGLS